MTVSASIERAQAEDPFPIRHGVFVAVVGPSGAGKDTLIDYARERLGDLDDNVAFIRRIITRPRDSGGEDHDCLTDAAFEEAKAVGCFSVDWEANGLKYALPASVDEIVRSGRVAVANCSRAAIADLRTRYANLSVILVTAAPEILAARLAERGRERQADILARLKRAESPALSVPGALVIDNSGDVEKAGQHFLAALRKAIAWSAVCDAV